jgi:hypothetical protein
MATKKPKRFNEGGVSDKDAGLEASKDDKVGFFERLRMGNIDEEGSEAYNRFGAGRGRAARIPVEDREATPVVRPMKPEMDELEAANMREPIPVPAGPRVEQPKPSVRPSVNVQASKPAASGPKMQEQTYRRTSGATAEGRSKAEPSVSNKYPESRGSVADSEAAELRRRVRAGDQAVERVTPETAMLPGGGLKGLSALAKKLASPKLSKYTQEALPAPTKRLEYDKAGAMARKRANRADMRREEMLKENAKRYGLDEEAPGYSAAADAVRKGLGGKDFALKKGGSVRSKPVAKKMASGGSVSSASKRGDGIATKGKTRCKIC